MAEEQAPTGVSMPVTPERSPSRVVAVNAPETTTPRRSMRNRIDVGPMPAASAGSVFATTISESFDAMSDLQRNLGSAAPSIAAADTPRNGTLDQNARIMLTTDSTRAEQFSALLTTQAFMGPPRGPDVASHPIGSVGQDAPWIVQGTGNANTTAPLVGEITTVRGEEILPVRVNAKNPSASGMSQGSVGQLFDGGSAHDSMAAAALPVSSVVPKNPASSSEPINVPSRRDSPRSARSLGICPVRNRSPGGTPRHDDKRIADRMGSEIEELKSRLNYLESQKQGLRSQQSEESVHSDHEQVLPGDEMRELRQTVTMLVREAQARAEPRPERPVPRVDLRTALSGGTPPRSP